MKSDWRDRIAVEPGKVSGYLLSSAHPTGRFKAAFFARFGFRASHGGDLVSALLGHGRMGVLAAVEETAFGRKYTVEGPLITPDGRNPLVRSVWFEAGVHGPVRLVTVYPLGGQS